ncbi:hypothetical protein R7W53_02215, partial [Mesomycoplasma ovipneumoniae]|uniref:hypothetical protein n=1 Tax=Mesomycoplasma ovipneumoniae TaxID=29562 RepID=UPI0029643BC7
ISIWKIHKNLKHKIMNTPENVTITYQKISSFIDLYNNSRPSNYFSYKNQAFIWAKLFSHFLSLMSKNINKSGVINIIDKKLIVWILCNLF